MSSASKRRHSQCPVCSMKPIYVQGMNPYALKCSARLERGYWWAHFLVCSEAAAGRERTCDVRTVAIVFTAHIHQKHVPIRDLPACCTNTTFLNELTTLILFIDRRDDTVSPEEAYLCPQRERAWAYCLERLHARSAVLHSLVQMHRLVCKEHACSHPATKV